MKVDEKGSALAAFELVKSEGVLPSPMRAARPDGRVLRVGAVQHAWVDDAAAMATRVGARVAMAAAARAEIVFLQELTLSPYFCSRPDVDDALDRFGEDLETGPTVSLLRSFAVEFGVAVHGSLYERTRDGRGFNTAVCVGADGALVARTRKTHIPEFPSYRENMYFEPSGDDPTSVDVGGVRYGFPTCWDQWFPELARMLSMNGAQVIVYPTAIGNEPNLPVMDSQPLWQQMIMANGLANSTFMVAVNRIGTEGPLTFYRSSWGMLYTRRPQRYERLLDDCDLGRPTFAAATSGGAQSTGVWPRWRSACSCSRRAARRRGPRQARAPMTARATRARHRVRRALVERCASVGPSPSMGGCSIRLRRTRRIRPIQRCSNR